jgi:hypothetical protein
MRASYFFYLKFFNNFLFYFFKICIHLRQNIFNLFYCALLWCLLVWNNIVFAKHYKICIKFHAFLLHIYEFEHMSNFFNFFFGFILTFIRIIIFVLIFLLKLFKILVKFIDGFLHLLFKFRTNSFLNFLNNNQIFLFQ